MAKKSSIEKNNRRKRMTKNAAPKRERLKKRSSPTRRCRWRSGSLRP
ncbi:hypothetical protein ACVWZK_004791 [Bradyrhizobium sp. GM0.4]